MAKKKSKANKTKNIKLFLFIIAMISIFPVVFFVYFRDRIYPNIYIAGVNVGGKTKDEAIKLIEPKLAAPKEIILKYKSEVFNLPLEALNINLDKENTIKEAMQNGRSGNIVYDIAQIASQLNYKNDYPLKINFDEALVNNFIQKISESIDYPAQDAKFSIVNGKVQTFSENSDGLQTQKEKLENEIIAAIKGNSSQKVEIDIPVSVVKPNVKTSDVNNLGINELIGSGTSRFSGSAWSRTYNINLAASRINNSLIAPNQTFSFNGQLGDISADTGYKEAYIIQNGQTVLGDGGGVCQVSTTLFRAAINAGLPIIERHAHAYRVHYYEEDAPPGFDATVYTPKVDFKFKNDTQNYILVQTQIDLKKLILTFNIYGTKDGRTVNITKPTLWDWQKAPENLYADDPTLPIGQTKQIDFAATGIKSQFEYTVAKDGQTINHQFFYSDFQPWQAKFLKGTKV